MSGGARARFCRAATELKTSGNADELFCYVV